MELDETVLALRALREDSGQPSFGDIALGVSRLRRDRGLTADQARVGRTTVYDAFRLGRSRLDAELVGDIVRAMGGTAGTAEDFAAKCRAAQLPRSSTASSGLPEPTESAGPTTLTKRALLAVVLGCVAVNFLGQMLVEEFELNVFLDMTGTAVAAILLGPWWGALVGVVTNVVGMEPSGAINLAFLPVNVVGALIWGYGARHWRLGRSIPRFFALNVLVGVGCTLVAVPIILLLLGGTGQHAADSIAASIQASTNSELVALYGANLLVSVPDKLIAGFVALALIEALPVRLHAWAADDWLSGSPDPAPAVRGRSGTPESV